MAQYDYVIVGQWYCRAIRFVSPRTGLLLTITKGGLMTATPSMLKVELHR